MSNRNNVITTGVTANERESGSAPERPFPEYDVTTITYADEPFGTDAAGSPSESRNTEHLRRVIEARDMQEAERLTAERR